MIYLLVTVFDLVRGHAPISTHLILYELFTQYEGAAEALVRLSECAGFLTLLCTSMLQKRDKMLGESRILSLFLNLLNKFNKT